MSQENVDSIRAAYEAFARGGPEAALPFLDPEVEWHDLADQPESAVHHGHEGFVRALETFTEPFTEYTVTVEELRDIGDYVLASICIRGRGRSSGAEFNQKATTLFEMRGGKAVRCRSFNTPEEALEAAALSE